MTKLRASSVWVSILVFTMVVAMCANASEFDPLEEVYKASHLVCVPPTSAPPRVDGIIGETEWDVATAFTGFLGYSEQTILTDSPTVFAAYDSEAIYLLCLVPNLPGRAPVAKETKRDGPVHLDDSVEVYLLTDKRDLFQIVANALGTLMDFRNNNIDWNADFDLVGGHIEGKALPASWGLASRDYWFVEMKIPFESLGVAPPGPGDTWVWNVAANRGGPWAVLAPIKGGLFANTDVFLSLSFLGPQDPYVQITSLGEVRFGRMDVRGRLFNPGPEAVKLAVDVDLRKEGSYLTHDAYRNIVGAISSVTKPFSLPAAGRQEVSVENIVTDTSINLMAVRVAVLDQENKPSRNLLVVQGNVKIEPPLILQVGNVPSRGYAVLNLDTSGLSGQIGNKSVSYQIKVLDSAGKTALTMTESAPVGVTEVQVDYCSLPVGKYAVEVDACVDGNTVSSAEGAFRILDKPVWLSSTVYDDYGKMDRVPLPWEPVSVDGRTVRVWGRSFTWRHDSILPSSITSQGVELLKSPMRLVASIDGREWTVPMSTFAVTDRKKMRVSMVASGAVNGLAVTADMWVEYDGLLWLKLAVNDSVKGRNLSALRVVTDMDTAQTPLYQSHNNAMTGYIGDSPIRFAWVSSIKENIANFYHWFGNEDRGLGFTYTSLEHWAPTTEDDFATLRPGKITQSYTINLIEKPVSADGRSFTFGVQATPIKPLPPDYHSMMAASISYSPSTANLQIPENFDIWLSWPEPITKIMMGLNNPYNVDEKLMSDVVKFAHDHGVAITTVASCPQKVSPNDEYFDDYITEWMVQPESVLNWNGTRQVQNCGRSYTLRKWLFYGWAVENVKKFGTEGIYFDGWQSGSIACANPHHGCGWTDEDGQRHVEVPILEGREFNHRMCLWLEDNVRSPHYGAKTAPERPGFPNYHYWIHSWCFVPSVMGFATEWLTGEFTGYPQKGPSMLTPEGTYGKSSSMGEFRTRALSTNWGVTNMFDALMWENSEDSPNKQTLNAFAWFLPHGVPFGLSGYVNQKTLVEITRLMMDFEVRKSEFIPAWRPNPHVKIKSPVALEVMAATWEHRTKNRVLIVVSNLKVEEAHDVVVEWTGFPKASLKNARTGEPITMNDGLFTVRLEPESFILIEASRTE